MVSMTVDGLDDLVQFFGDISEMPQAVLDDMLDKSAAVVRDAHKQKLQQLKHVRTEQLVKSIKSYKGKGNSRIIQPGGTRQGSHRVMVPTIHKKAKNKYKPIYVDDDGNRISSKYATNRDVGFVLEVGAPKRNIPASQWMRLANESASDEVVGTAATVYDNWLNNQNGG